MRRLSLGRLSFGSRRRDRGAAAIIVTLLFSGGVLLGSAALTVDVGQRVTERRSLQNGADAAALSLAQTCARAATSCTTAGAAASGLTSLNNQNAGVDQTSQFDVPSLGGSYPVGICQKNVTVSDLPSCATPSGSLGDCLPVPAYLTANAIPYVEVHTLTRTAGGSSILPSVFGQTLAGGYAGAPVHACSRASWGSPGGVQQMIPVTISGCDWQHATLGNSGGGGGLYYQPPVYGTAGGNASGYGGSGQPPYPLPAAPPPVQLPGQEVILMIQNPGGGGLQSLPCPTWQGHALPGGFGLLEANPVNNCVAMSYPSGWLHTSTGNSTACDLFARVGSIAYVPVFDCTANYQPSDPPPVPGQDCTTGNGNNAWFHLQGFAAFYISGYNLNITGGTPNKAKSLVSNQYPCSGGASCLSGWFVSGSLNSNLISGPPTGGGFFGSFTVLAAG